METLTAKDTVKLESQRIRVALEDMGYTPMANLLRDVYGNLPADNPQAWTELRRLVFALRHN